MPSRKGSTVSLTKEHMLMLNDLKLLIEQDIENSLPQYAKYHPEILYRQILGSLIEGEYKRMKETNEDV